jgi:phospholipase D1/2
MRATISLYNGTTSHFTNQYFCNKRPFSSPRTGNKVTVLSCGRDAMQNIHDAMLAAEKFIWIADWQMAFDVELANRGSIDHPGRLRNLIEYIISKKSVHIRVLLFESLIDNAPPFTYDGKVSSRLNALNKKHYPGSVHVILQPPTSDLNVRYPYSHHQKFVVVDGRTAFLGGIDLSYGRWETAEFDVVVDPERFVINEMYNPCETKLRPASKTEHDKIEKYGFVEPYGGKLIEEGCQPRMPWQDVHIRIDGPSAVDVHRNFARRWNSRVEESWLGKNNRFAIPIGRTWLEKIGAWSLLCAAQTMQSGDAQVQIVRSVSSNHLKMEGIEPDDLFLYSENRERSNWQQFLREWQKEPQPNILDAMVNCIRAADNYIYIETQFFISQFGLAGVKASMSRDQNGARILEPATDSRKIGQDNKGMNNIVIDELAQKIHQHIIAEILQPFHVYLVFPTHPEGQMTDGSVWKQHWLALSTIKHGSDSLINRIKRSLVGKKRDPEEWKQYLTVLNMRNYGATVQYARDQRNANEDFTQEIGRFVVTEQIYIHSKLLIVDDAVAIVGSANTNDRSLTGNGDTEIAAVVVDTEGVELRDLGSPKFKVQTRKFARDLRRELWTKHFGFMINSIETKRSDYFPSTTRAERARVAVPAEIIHPPRVQTTAAKILEASGKLASWNDILDKPCAPATVKAIQTIAEKNAQVYEDVFQHTPRNSMKTFDAITSFHTLPYPVLFNQLGSVAVQQLGFTGLTLPKATAQDKAIFEKLRIDAYHRDVDNGGKDFRFAGVVPPALQRQFMTSKLLPHQTAGLNQTNYGRRQQLYTDGTVHDVDAAIAHLRNKVVGFFVAAPLDWGMAREIDGDVSKHMSIDLTKADLKSDDRHEGPLV